MRKKMWVYICDICGEMKPEELHYYGDGCCHAEPSGWKTDVGTGKLCLCGTCYNSLVKLTNKNDKEEKIYDRIPIIGCSAREL